MARPSRGGLRPAFANVAAADEGKLSLQRRKGPVNLGDVASSVTRLRRACQLGNVGHNGIFLMVQQQDGFYRTLLRSRSKSHVDITHTRLENMLLPSNSIISRPA